MTIKTRIVIFGNSSFKVTEDCLLPYGGAESQLEKLARELGKAGYRVTIIFPGEIKFVKEYPQYAVCSVPGNWSELKAIFSLLKDLRRIKPQIIISRAATPLIFIYGLLGLFLRSQYLYFSAHDWELSPRENRLTGWRWKLFRLGLRLCSAVFVQNETQKEGFSKLLAPRNPHIEVIENLPLLEAMDSPVKDGDYFTWVGTYRKHKRPEWVIEIAKQLPAKKFRIILHCWNDKDMEAQFRQKLQGMENIEFIPGVPRGMLPKIYRQSLAVLITSEGEGFPNVAIEAWTQGRAVISTPSNVLNRLSEAEGVILADGVDDFVRIIRVKSEDEFYGIGSQGLHYMTANYSAERILEKIQRRF